MKLFLPPSPFAGVAFCKLPNLKWLLPGQVRSRASRKDGGDHVVLRRQWSDIAGGYGSDPIWPQPVAAAIEDWLFLKAKLN